MDHHPDFRLPREEMSLRRFNRIAREILTGQGDEVYEYVLAVLAGRYYTPNNELKRIVIDPLRGLTHPTACAYDDVPTEDEFKISRDYDSILGFSDTLPYKVPLAIYPVPPYKETLSKAVHITVPCRSRSVCRALYCLGDSNPCCTIITG